VRLADHSSGGVLPKVVCLSVIVKPRSLGGPVPRGLLRHGGGGGTSTSRVRTQRSCTDIERSGQVQNHTERDKDR